jgi:DNA-binding GntR family transcriptional regulator
MESTINQHKSNAFENHTLADQIFRVLKASVIRQEYQAGERLVDQEIADRLGVSRTPVREAINRLAAEGLLTITPRRGVFVTEISEDDIKEMYEVREALETLAVRLAFRADTNQLAHDLREIMRQYQSSLEMDDLFGCYDLDRQFHDCLVEASQNSMLVEMYHALSGKIQVSRWKHCRDRHRTNKTRCEHDEIITAFQDNDVDRAINAVQDHIRKVRVDLLAYEGAPSP